MYNAVDSFDPMMVAPQAPARDNRTPTRDDIAGPSFDDHMRQDLVRAAPDSDREEVQTSSESQEPPLKNLAAEETQSQQQTQTAQDDADADNATAAAAPTAKPAAPQDCAYLVQTLAEETSEAEPDLEPSAGKAETAHDEKHSKVGKAEAPDSGLALTPEPTPQPAPLEAPCTTPAPIVNADADAPSSDQHDDPAADDAELSAVKPTTVETPPVPMAAPRVETTAPTQAKTDASTAIDAEAPRGAEPTAPTTPESQGQTADSNARGDAQTKNEQGRPSSQAQSTDAPNLNPGVNASANAAQAQGFTPTFDTAQPLTSTSAAAAQASTAEAARTLPVHAQIGREIIRQFDGENTKFELRLDPPELGRVEIKLEVSRDHRVNAIVTADNPQALADLARSARELASALQSSGLELNENGLSFNLSQKQSKSADQDTDRRNPHQNTSAEIEPVSTPTQRLTLESWRGGRIDLVA